MALEEIMFILNAIVEVLDEVIVMKKVMEWICVSVLLHYMGTCIC